MTGFPIGIIALFIVSILIYLGLAQRVLDRMRLSDKGALAIIGAIIVGSFINIPLPLGRISTSINVGGALVPIGLAIYVLSRANSFKEWVRALIATVITAAAVYYIGSLLNSGIVEPAGRFAYVDALYLYPIIGGIVGYIAGRSRRSAFIAATLGVLSVDIIQYFWLVSAGAPAGTPIIIGGAGVFDAIVLSGVVAVLLAELVGEIRERIQGGPKSDGRPDNLVAALKKPSLDMEASEEYSASKNAQMRQGKVVRENEKE